MKEREGDPLTSELDRAMKTIGELTIGGGVAPQEVCSATLTLEGRVASS